MTMQVDTGTIVEVIISCFAAHYVVMSTAIYLSVAKLGRSIAENYATKDDLRNAVRDHVEDFHD